MKEELKENELATLQSAGVSRRRFLAYAGAFAGAGFLVSTVTSCRRDDSNVLPMPAGAVDLGSGDYGILNYAYALEQLEAAFYTEVVSKPYSGIDSGELMLLTDIRDHEIAHREFFKNALGTNAIQGLEVDFSSIDFTSRTSVLSTAKAFEDLGVQAYNGAGKLIANADYLVIAGKIVSVEARHAAYIRDLITNGTFADSTDANGMDMAMDPAGVLSIAGKYLKTKVSANNLPTT